MIDPNVRSSTQIDLGAIELGPDLPLADFVSVRPWNSERIGALALYCSDGRWGEAFDEFCQKHLQIPRYDRWAVPGGPAWLTGNSDPGFFQTARLQLDFLVQAHGLEQIVLITHYGCAYYGHQLQQSPNECLTAQVDDVRTVAATLRGWYPEMRVDSYLAMRSANRLSFHGLEA